MIKKLELTVQGDKITNEIDDEREGTCYEENYKHQCQCKYCICLNDVDEWENVCYECLRGAHQG